MENNEQTVIEEVSATAPAVTTNEEKVPYQMDIDPIKVTINLFPQIETKQVLATHVMRRPTFDEEEARERMMPLIISDAGKVDGASASSMTLDDEPANVRMYDKIALSVIGYQIEAGVKPSDASVPVTKVIKTADGDKTLLEAIPIHHKSAAISGLFPADYEMDLDEDEELFYSLAGSSEFRVKQNIGGRFPREDGTLSPPDFEVLYTLNTPSQEDRKKFRSQAISALTLTTTSGRKDRRSTNLRVIRELFDKLIERVDNATIGGAEIDVRNKAHLNTIPATFKKGVILKFFNFLDADLAGK